MAGRTTGRPSAGCGLEAGFALATACVDAVLDAAACAFAVLGAASFAAAREDAAASTREDAAADPPRSSSKDASNSSSSKSKTPLPTCFGAFAATSWDSPTSAAARASTASFVFSTGGGTVWKRCRARCTCRLYVPSSIWRQMRIQYIEYVLYFCVRTFSRKRSAVFRICSLRSTANRRSTSLRGTVGSSFSKPRKYWS